MNNKSLSIFCAIIVAVAISSAAFAEKAKPEEPLKTAPHQSAPAATVENKAAESIQPVADEKAKAELTIKPGDYVLGDRKAKITIYEYASLSCPHCAQFGENTLPKLVEKYISTGKVNLVFRNFPLNEPALRAAMVAHCAAESAGDKKDEVYNRYIKVFFSSQKQWAPEANFVKIIENIARLGGMSKESFDKCVNNSVVEKQVLEIRKAASDSLSVDSTPTFFINHTKIQGTHSFEEFRGVIDPLLKTSK